MGNNAWLLKMVMRYILENFTHTSYMLSANDGGMEISMNSIWTETVELPHFEKLQENIKTDVLVIGGGMAGILCAYMLEQAGVDYALVEASKICSGITQNTTGKITSQHGLIYHELLDRFGVEKTRMYLDANNRALENYRSLCSNIECDFEEKDAFVYSVKNVELCAKELDALGQIGYSAFFASSIPLPFNIAGAVKFNNQAQFHPLKFIAGIAPGLRIYENTFVKEIRDHTAVTPNGEIRAGKIIVATHFPFLNRHGSYFLKMYQHRSYVIAFENASKINGMYVDEAEKGMSFRNYKNLLLVGGGDHRTGKQGGNWAEIKNFTNIYYCGLEERGRWATQDCMTLDGVPYIGQYSANTPDLYVATGFNKWGMTSSMVAAEILKDMVIGKENPYAEVFSPSRNVLCSQLAVNAFEAITNLLTLSHKRCPHMGCSLKWNPQEHSWDCPCHGSRFGQNGELIDNPAMRDLK